MTSVRGTQGVFMEHARNLGSAFAKRDGEVSSVTRTSTTVPTTSPVDTGALASTLVRAHTRASVHQGLLELTVRRRSMTVLTTPASMEGLAR